MLSQKRLYVLSQTPLRLNQNVLVFYLKRTYVFS